VATGGTTGQVLVKNSGTNFDTGWTTPQGTAWFSVSGVWNPSPYLGALGNTSLANSDRVHYTPHFATKKQTITDVMGHVGVAGVGATIRYGIYTADANFEPATLLAQATVDASTTGVKTTSIGPVDVEGLFFVAGVPQGSNVTYSAGAWTLLSLGYETTSVENAIVGPLYHTTGVSGSMSSNPILVTEAGNLVRFHRIKVKYA
jgi:hypothetical protein